MVCITKNIRTCKILQHFGKWNRCGPNSRRPEWESRRLARSSVFQLTSSLSRSDLWHCSQWGSARFNLLPAGPQPTSGCHRRPESPGEALERKKQGAHSFNCWKDLRRDAEKVCKWFLKPNNPKFSNLSVGLVGWWMVLRHRTTRSHKRQETLAVSQ